MRGAHHRAVGWRCSGRNLGEERPVSREKINGWQCNCPTFLTGALQIQAGIVVTGTSPPPVRAALGTQGPQPQHQMETGPCGDRAPQQWFRLGRTLAVGTQAATGHTHLPPGFSGHLGPPRHPSYPCRPHRDRVFPVIVGGALGSGRWGDPAVTHGRPGFGPRSPETKEALACRQWAEAKQVQLGQKELAGMKGVVPSPGGLGPCGC